MVPQIDSQPPELPTARSKKAATFDFAWRTRASDRALVAIFTLLVIAAATILLLSSPAEREIFIKGELPSFHLPHPAELDLPQINRVHMRGIEMKFNRVSSLQLRDPMVSKARAFSGELLIVGSTGQPAASAVLLPVGRRGPFGFLIPARTVISARLLGNSKSISLKHLPPSGERIVLSLESDSIDIAEANRVTLRPALPWSSTEEPSSRSLVVSNEDEMIKLESVCYEECSIEIPLTEFSYLQNGGSMRVNPSQKVVLSDFRASSLILRGVKEPDMNTTHPSALEFVTGQSFSWVDISAGSAAIRVTGRGVVTSLRQDGREVLPSRAADLIAADPARRGVYGGAALLLVFAWGVLFNRAVDIIAKILLPE